MSEKKEENPLLGKLRETVNRYRMFSRGEKVLVAVSGGPDSMALLQALNLLAAKEGLSLAVVHLNHGLRGKEADREEDFVRQWAGKLELSFFSRKVSIGEEARAKGLSKQVAAREERYRFFAQIAEQEGADKIALGHTADDQAETLLMRLMRGAGTGGMGGIPPVREGKIVRPLLEVSREEIMDFLEKGGYSCCQDPSNEDPRYERSRVRHRLLPLMKREFNPNIVKTLCREASIFRGDEEILQELVREKLASMGEEKEDAYVLDLHSFRRCSRSLQGRLIREAVSTFQDKPYLLYAAQVEELINLAAAEKGEKRLVLPGELRVMKEYNRLSFYRDSIEETGESPSWELLLEVPGEIVLPCEKIRVEARYCEGDEVDLPHEENVAFFSWKEEFGPLILRNRRAGDVFCPSGMRGKKRLKSFFIDCKIPRREREKLPLIVSPKGILWIPGVRRSSLLWPNPAKEKILRISYASLEKGK